MAEHLVVLKLTPEAIAALPAAAAALREHVLGADELATALAAAAAELPAALSFPWAAAELVADLRRPPVMGERQASHDYEVGLVADGAEPPRRIVLYARGQAHALEAGEDFARTCLPRGWRAATARRVEA